MKQEEIENLANNLAEEYERFKDELPVENYIKRVIEITNLHWQEKTRWKSLLTNPPKLLSNPSEEKQVLIKHAKGGYDVKFLVKQSSIDYWLKEGFVFWKEIE